jgi:hypothetical protein
MLGSDNIKKHTATVYEPVNTEDPNTGEGSTTYSQLFTAQAVYWTGAAAARLVPETHREKVSAVILFDYSTNTASIIQNYKIDIDNKSFLAMTDGEDIAGQNRYIQVATEQFT